MNLEHLLIIIKLLLFHNMIIMIYFYIHIKEKQKIENLIHIFWEKKLKIE